VQEDEEVPEGVFDAEEVAFAVGGHVRILVDCRGLGGALAGGAALAMNAGRDRIDPA